MFALLWHFLFPSNNKTWSNEISSMWASISPYDITINKYLKTCYTRNRSTILSSTWSRLDKQRIFLLVAQLSSPLNSKKHSVRRVSSWFPWGSAIAIVLVPSWVVNIETKPRVCHLWGMNGIKNKVCKTSHIVHMCVLLSFLILHIQSETNTPILFNAEHKCV